MQNKNTHNEKASMIRELGVEESVKLLFPAKKQLVVESGRKGSVTRKKRNTNINTKSYLFLSRRKKETGTY